MRLSDPPIALYSVNTWLAYMISMQYYGDLHFVWCAPAFNAVRLSAMGYTVPVSSRSEHIYRRYQEDVASLDRHSAAIRDNKMGIRTGIEAKRAAGIVSEETAKALDRIVETADIRDFRPLLFVIPFAAVASRVLLAPAESRANPFACEYQIAELPGELFDVVEFTGSLYV